MYFNDSVIGSDSEDDDDDVLEMVTASSRSRSHSASSVHRSPLALSSDLGAQSRARPPTSRRPSTDREHVSIAPIAPTLLKSTGVGNDLASLTEGQALESPKDVDLVYVPITSNYSLSGTPNMGASEDVYHHRESYFSVGTVSSYPRPPMPRSPAPGASPQIPSVGMPPESAGAPVMRRSDSGSFFPSQLMVDSPMHIDDVPLEDAYDYFGGPDLGEDFSHGRAPISRRRHRGDTREDDGKITRYSEGGAASVTTGRSSPWHASPSPSPINSPRTPDADMPVVVVNEVNGAVEERQERSRESSPSRSSDLYRIPEQQSSSPPCGTLSSTPAVPIPRVNPAHAHLVSSSVLHNSLPSSASGSGLCSDSTLLSPSDMPVRGRTPHSPSVSGSTTTGSSSYHSSDSRSGSSSRGRSSTRTSSFSDRERSGSRSRSRGTSSPLGSISPTGSAVGIGGGSAYATGRCRDRGVRDGGERDIRGSRHKGGEEERGRERTGRRLGDSLSPPSVVSSPSRRSSDEGVYQPYSPVLAGATLEKPSRAPSPPSSVSGSSTETASVSTVGPSTVQQQAQDSADRPRLSIHASSSKSPLVEPAIPEVEEEEERRSRHPTPANSPVAAFRMAVPPAQRAEPVSSPVLASHERSTSSSISRTPTKSPSSTEVIDSPDFMYSDPPVSPVSPTSRHPSRAQRVSFDGMQEQAGTLVTRAAEIVQSARGFLGSIWNSNPVAPA